VWEKGSQGGLGEGSGVREGIQDVYGLKNLHIWVKELPKGRINFARYFSEFRYVIIID
jgi:hypothetical protein